ncbi:MAG: 30S ribosomal protein S21 [Planctomycetes bacterium]|nr:30S ribosomal protein S21 [Planctomycetota bacterium]
MAKIKLASNESLEKALRRFKRMCNNEGIFSDFKRHAYYDKPSDRRRRENKRRIKTIRKYQEMTP